MQVAHTGQPAQPGRTVAVHPAETPGALVNPAMGWTMHFYSNIPTNYGSRLEPSDVLDDFPGLSTVYLRAPWADIEPEEGRFNWPLLDTPAQRFIARGKQVALRITSSENWMKFATPLWVKKAGAKGVFYRFGKGPIEGDDGPSWDPDFGDPVFLRELDHLLEALAARYDGNPNVAFVDVGSYGLWGEGHTMMSSRVPAGRDQEIIQKHIDLHLKHFKKTLLAYNDDFAGPDRSGAHHPETDRAWAQGLTLRDDSIMVQPPPHSWFHAALAQAVWPHRPVILEHEHYGPSKARGAWGDGHLLLQAVEEYHASYLSIHWWPHEFLRENREVIDRINRRLGYRIRLCEMSWPAQAAIGRPFPVRSQWANVGVAPCYPGGFPALTLKDAKQGIVAVLADDGFNVRSLKPGPAGHAPTTERTKEFTVGLLAPVVQPGTYDVYVSVGLGDGTPRIALPLADNDGQKRYRLGQITLIHSLEKP
ncbi:MAG: DUF4832 domain-containing protein [Isosphaeraceae bacterium]